MRELIIGILWCGFISLILIFFHYLCIKFDNSSRKLRKYVFSSAHLLPSALKIIFSLLTLSVAYQKLYTNPANLHIASLAQKFQITGPDSEPLLTTSIFQAVTRDIVISQIQLVRYTSILQNRFICSLCKILYRKHEMVSVRIKCAGKK